LLFIVHVYGEGKGILETFICIEKGKKFQKLQMIIHVLGEGIRNLETCI